MDQKNPQIRSERNANVAELAGLSVRYFVNSDAKFKLVNISETGFAANTPSNFKSGEDIQIKIETQSGQNLYEGRAKVAWVSNGAAGFAFVDRFLSEAFLTHLEVCNMISENSMRELEMSLDVPIEFRDLIFRMRRYLHNLKTNLDQQDEKNLRLGSESRLAFDEALKLVFTTSFIPTIRKFNVELDGLLRTVNDKTKKVKIITVFREELNAYLTMGPFTNRALHKPLGYAGDYEMMNQIYSESLEGLSSFSKLVHLYGITEHSSLSVLERRKLVAEKLVSMISKGGKFRITALACGPAKEVSDLIERLTPEQLGNVEINLLDQDIEALLNAKRNISSASIRLNKNIKVNYLHISVKDILEKKSNTLQLQGGTTDYVYTMGLYDYLTQPVAKFLTNELCGWLKPGGKLFIGNFNPNNPTKAISELSVDWRLIHRTDEEMNDLVPKVGVTFHKVSHDSQGIEVFLEITK